MHYTFKRGVCRAHSQPLVKNECPYPRKMVNVSSHLPFNLHNRALPEESFPNSRSGSRSVDIYHVQAKEHNQNTTARGRHWSSHEQYPIVDPPTGTNEQRPYSRSPSQNSSHRETLRREPILNVRLVGYESPSRGRSMRPEVASLPDSEKSPPVGSPDPPDGAAALVEPQVWAAFSSISSRLANLIVVHSHKKSKTLYVLVGAPDAMCILSHDPITRY